MAGLSQAEPGRHTQEREDHMIRALKETLASSKALCLSLGHMTKFTQPQPCLAWELLPPPRGVNPA